MTVHKKSVIVIGAGAAGLAAAVQLAKSPNVHVTLLEARDRLGGRIVTRRDFISPTLESSGLVPPGTSKLPFDFGASWIHGVDPSNPLYALVEAGQVEYVHTDSDQMFFAPGQLALPTDESNYYWKVVWDLLDEAQEYATEHRDQIPDDMSFRTWLEQYLDSRPTTPEEGQDDQQEGSMSAKLKQAVRGLSMYYADENAIPLEQVSMKYMDAEEIFPGDHSLVHNGFDRVVKVLVEQLKDVTVLQNHVVDKIEYNDVEVQVSTNKGIFTADQVLVTLPLGVLKAQAATLFSPPLPATKQRAIQHLGFGTMYKILLFFPRCFWTDNVHFINFLPSHLTRQPNPDLVSRFNLNPQQVEALATYMQDLANYSSLMPVYQLPILIGYATNRAAELMERLTDDEARMVYTCQMAHYYDILLSDKQGEGEALWPKVSFMSQWNQDPFAHGSYTSIPVGATTDDIKTFEVPVAAAAVPAKGNSNNNNNRTAVDDAASGRVFFAGEHTCPGHFASIQGALISGRREAAKILGLQEPSCTSTKALP
ncbi:amine oxidase [Mortierella sp. GBAus27b]|nr:amine oxidase [Mortierella sp. GBAus27b]